MIWLFAVGSYSSGDTMTIDSIDYKKVMFKKNYNKKILSKSSHVSSPFLILVNNHVEDRPILEINKRNLDEIFKCEKLN